MIVLAFLSLIACAVQVLGESTAHPVGSEGLIERVATLHTARAAHTATALPSGQVLVVGGMGAKGSSLATVELIDPATSRVEEVSPLAEGRSGHSATLLPDGRVLIVGGYDGEYLNSVELFDPSTRRFRSMAPLKEGRSGHTATLMPDGRILLVGGVGKGWTFLPTAELYDPRTGHSESVGSMLTPRESHTATLLSDGSVLVVGGHRGRREAMEVYASSEIFRPRNGRFEPAGTLAIARHKHDAVRLRDGRVLIIGGADRSDRTYYATTEIYDPAAGKFVPGPAMAHQRYKIAGTSILLPTGEVLVTSGAMAAELLDSTSTTFREVPGRLPQAYRFAAATALANGAALIVGGYSDDNQNTAGIWRFQPQ